MDKKIFPALININSSLHTAQGEAEGQITSTDEMALAYERFFPPIIQLRMTRLTNDI